MPFKKVEPSVRFDGNKLTPDELDFDLQYIVLNPNVNPSFLGSTAAGTKSQAKTLILTNVYCDYPRNLLVSVAGSAGSTVGGTFVISGKNQFGDPITESFKITTVADGGTKSGSLIFSKLTGGTFTFSSTMNAGPGTPLLGYPNGGTGAIAAGTQCIFGLPIKIGAVSDVKRIVVINFQGNDNALINNGTLNGTFVGTAYSSFCPASDVTGAEGYMLVTRSTFPAEFPMYSL